MQNFSFLVAEKEILANLAFFSECSTVHCVGPMVTHHVQVTKMNIFHPYETSFMVSVAILSDK